MSWKRAAFIKLFIGLVLLVIGAAVHWWARQLVWITIYPPPIKKQILDVLPYLFWVSGVVLTLGSTRRLLRAR